MRHRVIGAVAALTAIVWTTEASAGVMIQPTAVSTDMGMFNGVVQPTNTNNLSGLSANYTSGVTDFDTYIAGAPTHNGVDTNIWLSAFNSVTGHFDFTLGGTFSIESFAFWNLGENQTQNVIGFTLLADDENTFTGAANLGSFTASPAGTLAAIPVQVFTFAPTSASFVRMQITSNNGNSFTGFGEAAFEAFSAVPEPSSFALVGLCVAGLGVAAYRKRQARRATA